VGGTETSRLRGANAELPPWAATAPPWSSLVYRVAQRRRRQAKVKVKASMFLLLVMGLTIGVLYVIVPAPIDIVAAHRSVRFGPSAGIAAQFGSMAATRTPAQERSSESRHPEHFVNKETTMDLATGALMGMAYSAAPGPVNLVTIRRGMHEGPRAALAVYCGASLADLACALAALMGLGLLAIGTTGHMGLGIVGTGVLIVLGWSALVDGWKVLGGANSRSAHAGSSGRVTTQSRPRYVRALWVGAALTLCDPLVPVFWLSVGSTSLHQAGHSGAQLLSGFFISVVLWGLVLALASGWRRLALHGRLAAWASLGCGLGLMGSGLALGRTLLS
jgi:L-lysine exporter family protein LysE/ArgO